MLLFTVPKFCKGETRRMKNRKFDKYIYIGVTAILVLITACLLVFAFVEREALFAAGAKVLDILMPVIYGAVMAFLLAPVYNHSIDWYEAGMKKITKNQKLINKFKGMVGTVSSVLFLVFVLFSLSSMILPELYTNIINIANSVPEYYHNVYQWLVHLFENNPELEAQVLYLYREGMAAVQSYISAELLPSIQNLDNLQNIIKFAGDVSYSVMGVFTILKNLVLGIFVMVYLLNLKDTLAAQCKKLAYSFLPLSWANGVIDEFRFIHKSFGEFFIGKVIDSLIIGVLCFVGMTLFKMPYTLLISVIIGVTNVIPFFGPFIGAIPSAVLVLIANPGQFIWFILWILVLQQFDGNILGPKILGNATGLSSFWVLFSILFFGGIYGFIGMIIGVPVTAVIFDLISKLQNYFLGKKSLPCDTDHYMELQKIDEADGRFIKTEKKR